MSESTLCFCLGLCLCCYCCHRCVWLCLCLCLSNLQNTIYIMYSVQRTQFVLLRIRFVLFQYAQLFVSFSVSVSLPLHVFFSSSVCSFDLLNWKQRIKSNIMRATCRNCRSNREKNKKTKKRGRGREREGERATEWDARRSKSFKSASKS